MDLNSIFIILIMTKILKHVSLSLIALQILD